MGTVGNISVDPINAIWGGVDLGFIDGDVEVTMEEQSVDITAHQYGTNVLSAIRTGKSMEVSLTLKETSVAQLTTLINQGGAAGTATAEVSTVVIGSVTSINSKYFDIWSANDAIAYRVWFDVNNTGVAPSSTGKTLVEVDLDATPTVAEAVTALTAALDGLAAFTAVESGGTTVTITNASTGGSSDIVDGNTGFTFSVTTQGSGTAPGWGTSKDFTSVLTQAAKLVLHPVVLGSSVQTRDLCFWKAYPMLDSISHSGENPKLVSVTFKVYPDLNRNAQSQYFVFGESY